MRADSLDRPVKLLLDYKGAAEALSFSEQALRDLVSKGRGPVVTEVGRRRMFAIADLEEFVARHRKPPTPPDILGPFSPRRRGRRKPQ
jgi:hypothetical protein